VINAMSVEEQVHPQHRYWYISQAIEVWDHLDTTGAVVRLDAERLASRHAAATAASAAASSSALSEKQLLDIERKKVEALQRKLEKLQKTP
jgi:hypothetical protein